MSKMIAARVKEEILSGKSIEEVRTTWSLEHRQVVRVLELQGVNLKDVPRHKPGQKKKPKPRVWKDPDWHEMVEFQRQVIAFDLEALKRKPRELLAKARAGDAEAIEILEREYRFRLIPLGSTDRRAL